MIYRFTLLTLFLIIQSIVHSQAISWNNKRDGGDILFEDTDITFLVVKFEKRAEIDRATQIYNNRLDKFQKELEQVLETSGLKYEIVSSSELSDSTYSDSIRYPVVINHGLHMTYSHNNGMYYSFLHIYVVDRKSDVIARVNITHQATKYGKAFQRFFSKIRKGKSMKFRIGSPSNFQGNTFAPSDDSIEID